MVVITATLLVKGKSDDALCITAAIVALMWLVFLVGFSGLASVGKLRALAAPASWWASLTLIIVFQVAVVHLVITALWQGSYLGAGIGLLFFVALFRSVLDFIQARRKEAHKVHPPNSPSRTP